jgi:hypothetical protein
MHPVSLTYLENNRVHHTGWFQTTQTLYTRNVSTRRINIIAQRLSVFYNLTFVI